MNKSLRKQAVKAILRGEKTPLIEQWNQWADRNSFRMNPYNVTIKYILI